jgi:alpha-ketoglutarate-dependent taurine dioxygenase
MDRGLKQRERLLDAIRAHIVNADITWTHQWRASDVLMWDKHCTVHRRDARVYRVMHHITSVVIGQAK